MSDEYANSGFRGSLADRTAGDTVPGSDYDTRNYPSADDSTSSGGYRGSREPQQNVIDQPLFSASAGQQQPDAQQGRDRTPAQPRELNPYADDSLESRRQAEEMLASSYKDTRERQQLETSHSGLESDSSA
ncbi:hypothetical protein K488DRAFT_87123 [Vararia minispora EC-137]|uniref:Uncharacterized protein n=1 Tax=Vararia minispora EC-137 TaxID=1314806 RepID=A0ACB8QHN7_9AGAM|nr:hypothetical protein K488DRAFT_87123 [Vararia minispora EC-137]